MLCDVCPLLKQLCIALQQPMALWARTQQLTGHYLRQLQELYTPRFPMDVRHSIAEWLEAQNWQVGQLYDQPNRTNAYMYFHCFIIILSFTLLPPGSRQMTTMMKLWLTTCQNKWIKRFVRKLTGTTCFHIVSDFWRVLMRLR